MSRVIFFPATFLTLSALCCRFPRGRFTSSPSEIFSPPPQPLHVAVHFSKSPGLVKLLLASGKDCGINAVTRVRESGEGNYSALALALAVNDKAKGLEMVDMLLAAKANVNIQDAEGCTVSLRGEKNCSD